jgi:3-phenylpropionate/cinnamic acid dioxygenase small subunit
MTPATEPALDRGTRDGVTDLLVRYATAIDCRDWALLRTCFTEDCDADYGAIGRWRGADEITAWMASTHDPLGPTMHRITNVTLAQEPGLVRTRCYVHGVVVLPDRSAAVHAFGWYDDEVVATPVGWRVARRRFTPVTTELHSPMD